MLLLIEPPGTKHQDVTRSDTQRGQHLLEYNTPEEDEEPDSDDVAAPTTIGTVASCTQKMDKLLVGKSDSCEFSDRWKREFSERPSWCDADMALQQIKRGKARGNRAALYSRSLIQKALFNLGTFVHHHACLVMFTVVMFFSFCCYGLQYVRIETDIVKLWVARGGRLEEELNFLSRIDKLSSNEAHGETGLGGAYQVVIQTPVVEGDNILTQEGLLEHVTILEQIAKYKVNVAGENWTLSDLCFKPPSPKISSSFAAQFLPLIDKIIPCIWITPIDCFWEGSKAIGPHPSIESSSLGFGREFLTSLPNMDTLSWSNIDPQALLDELSEVLDLDNFNSFFHRANIGRGYLDRWCIDPLNPECPAASPNHFAFCDLIPRFLDYATKQGFEVPVDPEYLRREDEKKNLEDEYSFFGFLGKRRKRDLNKSAENYLIVEGMSSDTNRSELFFINDETIKANETELGVTNFSSKVVQNSTDNGHIGTFKISMKESTRSLNQPAGATENPKIMSSKITKEKG
uniref:SSD domain-containing protein n=1 Tax=Elaeophora elaphi TaxID=1147741 RepID=A0A0R3RKT7_9BILA